MVQAAFEDLTNIAANGGSPARAFQAVTDLLEALSDMWASIEVARMSGPFKELTAIYNAAMVSEGDDTLKIDCTEFFDGLAAIVDSSKEMCSLTAGTLREIAAH
ncbi:MAG: hypothetical protein BGO49_04490 [Planctomycetales bacterium 71-10]|nr:MAG: hypothetical protein BGO49_04490 [Planctomycetales bacterium 71-10]